MMIKLYIWNLLNYQFPVMEDMIADSMSVVIERSKGLSFNDQKAIGQELREWLQEGVCIDELLTIPVLK